MIPTLIAYMAAGVLLNSTIHFSFESTDERMRKYDEILSFIIFYPLWPIGIIVFIIKWFQGRASIGE